MTGTQEDHDRARAAGTDDETIGRNLTLEIAVLETKLHGLRRDRDTIISRLAQKHGPAKTARIVGVSLSTVKTIRRSSHPVTHDCELNHAGCTTTAELVEDSYEADVHNNPGQYIWACTNCFQELIDAI